MARSLQFVSGQHQFQCEIDKVDRNKLYGWVDKKAYDKNGKECYFGALSSDGMHLFGKTSFESGYINQQGQWLDRGQLQVVDVDNQLLSKRESSFNEAIILDQTVPIDTYLMHIAKSVYHLSPNPELLKLIRNESEIFCFPFNYYAGYNSNTAFLIETENEIFMVIGEACGFDFLEMQSMSANMLIEDEDEGDEEEEIDFSMF